MVRAPRVSRSPPLEAPGKITDSSQQQAFHASLVASCGMQVSLTTHPRLASLTVIRPAVARFAFLPASLKRTMQFSVSDIDAMNARRNRPRVQLAQFLNMSSQQLSVTAMATRGDVLNGGANGDCVEWFVVGGGVEGTSRPPSRITSGLEPRTWARIVRRDFRSRRCQQRHRLREGLLLRLFTRKNLLSLEMR